MNGATISVQVPTQDSKLAARGIESTCIVALPVLSQGQSDGGKCCIVLENVQTRSLIAKLPQCLSLAVTIRELHAAN